MEAVKSVKSVVFNGKRHQEWVTILRGQFFDIVVNGKKIAEVEAIPHALRELAVGYLMAHGYVQDPHSIESVRVLDDTIEVQANPEFDFRYEYLKDSPLEKIELKPLTSGYVVHVKKVIEKIDRGLERANFFKEFGCTEIAILSDDNGALFVAEGLTTREAVLKAMGKAASTLFDYRRAFLVTSGILLPEQVIHAAIAGIPIIGSLRGASSLAVELAESLNLTSFVVEGEKIRCFSHVTRFV